MVIVFLEWYYPYFNRTARIIDVHPISMSESCRVMPSIQKEEVFDGFYVKGEVFL